MDPELCEILYEEYTKHMNELNKRHNAAIYTYKAEPDKLERERRKLVQSIRNGVPGDLLKEEANRINDRKAELVEILAGVKE